MSRNPYLVGTGLGLASMAVAIFGGYACGAATDPPADAAPKMTFEQCQASGEYPGGRYAVEFDNGVCTVQKPADVPADVPAEVSYANCDAARAAGKAPLHLGDPGYSSKLDRDGDGTACDS
jgi:hypothetical protein